LDSQNEFWCDGIENPYQWLFFTESNHVFETNIQYRQLAEGVSFNNFPELWRFREYRSATFVPADIKVRYK